MVKFLCLLISVVISFNTFAQETGSFTDPRDGKTYKTVKIGDQVWMAENLNYETSGGCRTISEKYGRYYNWRTARNVCPKGWRLPSRRHLKILLDNFGGEGEDAYNALKCGGSSGFNALLGGYGRLKCHEVDRTGYWWSSSRRPGVPLPMVGRNAWSISVSRERQVVNMYSFSRRASFSVRCIKK